MRKCHCTWPPGQPALHTCPGMRFGYFSQPNPQRSPPCAVQHCSPLLHAQRPRSGPPPSITEAMTAPQTTSPLETYHAYLRRHELAYQFSPEAGRAVFFPRLVCPFSGSTALKWRVSRGAGTVHATTVVHPREGAPYNVALIDLDEGFRMMSRVDGLPPADVRIGLRVQVRFDEQAGEPAPLPVFAPLGEVAP